MKTWECIQLLERAVKKLTKDSEIMAEKIIQLEANACTDCACKQASDDKEISDEVSSWPKLTRPWVNPNIDDEVYYEKRVPTLIVEDKPTTTEVASIQIKDRPTRYSIGLGPLDAGGVDVGKRTYYIGGKPVTRENKQTVVSEYFDQKDDEFQLENPGERWEDDGGQ